MNVTEQISPLPWTARHGDMITDAEGDPIAQVLEACNGDSESNLDFIAKAASAHPKLVEILKAVRDLLQQERHIPLVLIEAALMEAGEPI